MQVSPQPMPTVTHSSFIVIVKYLNLKVAIFSTLFSVHLFKHKPQMKFHCMCQPRIWQQSLLFLSLYELHLSCPVSTSFTQYLRHWELKIATFPMSFFLHLFKYNPSKILKFENYIFSMSFTSFSFHLFKYNPSTYEVSSSSSASTTDMATKPSAP